MVNTVLHYLNQCHPDMNEMVVNNTMTLTMRTRSKCYVLDCDVAGLNEGIRIELGVDFLRKNKFALRLDGDKLGSVKDHPLGFSVQRFVITVEVNNVKTKAVIDTSLIQSQIYPVQVR